MEQIKVFVSYPRERSRDLQIFLTHTSDLARAGVTFFYDEQTRWGEAWKSRLYQEIDSAHIFVALVTAEYLASEWCMRELNQAFMLMRAARCRVLPVHVAPFDAAPDSPFRALQMMPSGKSITQRGRKQVEAWAQVASALREQVTELGTSGSRAHAVPTVSLHPGGRREGGGGAQSWWTTGGVLAVLLLAAGLIWYFRPQTASPATRQPAVLYSLQAQVLRVSSSPATCGRDKFDLDTNEPGHGNQVQFNLCRGPGRIADLILDPERLHAPDDARLLLQLETDVPLDFIGCSEALRKSAQTLVGSIPLSQLRAGEHLCIRTDEGLVAALTIVSLTAGSEGSLTFNATVWRNG